MINSKTTCTYARTYINSVGEGGMWVCNKNGPLENGDYISSSSIPGYGMKQTKNEDCLTNYTVAKITCNCDFNLTKSKYFVIEADEYDTCLLYTSPSPRDRG